MSTERTTESSLRIVWIYPDLLSTYGDRGNLLILARRAALRGLDVETLEVRSDQPLPSSGIFVVNAADSTCGTNRTRSRSSR